MNPMDKGKQRIKKTVVRLLNSLLIPILPIRGERHTFLLTAQYTSNALTYASYLVKEKPSCRVILIAEDSQLRHLQSFFSFAPEIKIVREKDKLRKWIYVLTSKYVYFQHGHPFRHIKKRSGQKVINLWHGCGYKRRGASEAVPSDGDNFDFVLVPGPVFIETKAEFFNCKKERILPIGYPEYDLFQRHSARAEGFIKEIKARSESNKVVIWLPTYRKSVDPNVGAEESRIGRAFDLPLLRDEKQTEELNRFLKERKIMLIIKRHPLQVRYKSEEFTYSNILFLNNQDLATRNIDLYELLPYTNALISDYSSIAIDYMLLNRPIAFALDDYDSYQAARGFVFDNPLDYMPGHFIYDYQNLAAYLQDVAEGKDPYQEKRKAIMRFVHNPCDNYCERLWDTLINL
ncbi:MAG: CDP-glycerol glycerophosphotransferase family protein [Clostridia bacterium]|nr:CDP-glycerol glycerophosphotransferase family protein [Clostridia bacterium]